jgi:hypothetical protein
MAAEQTAQYHLVIKQGATFRVALTWRDANGDVVPLEGQPAWLHIRRQTREAVPDEAPLFELTTANDRIILADDAPNITLYISAEDTSALTEWTKGEYDLLIELANLDRKRLFGGIATVSPGATRDVP